MRPEINRHGRREKSAPPVLNKQGKSAPPVLNKQEKSAKPALRSEGSPLAMIVMNEVAVGTVSDTGAETTAAQAAASRACWAAL